MRSTFCSPDFKKSGKEKVKRSIWNSELAIFIPYT